MVRRQKRDRSDRAFTKGYQTGVSGRSKDICPHAEPQLRQDWLSGWREGRADNWDGYTGVSGIHRLRIDNWDSYMSVSGMEQLNNTSRA